MAFTRKDLRQRIGGVEFCNDMLLSAASGNGSTTTLVDTSLKQADDWWNYGEILPLEGNGANAVRYITDWVQSTSTFTVDRAWGGATASGDDYEVHRLFRVSEKNAAINAAIRASGNRWCQRAEDSVGPLDLDVYTYSLASLSPALDPNLGIDELLYDPNLTGTGVPFPKISRSFWEVRWDAGTPTLQFLIRPPIEDENLRVVYRARPSQLSADSDNLTPDDESFANYVCAKATAILFRARALSEPDAGWADRANAMEALAESFYGLDAPQNKPKPVRSEMLLWGRG